MSVDNRLKEVLEAEARIRQIEADLRNHSGNGSGGGSGGFDPRLGRLEGQFDKLAEKIEKQGDRLSGAEVQLATLVERVSHLPTKGFIIGSLVTAVSILSGLVVIASRLGIFKS